MSVSDTPCSEIEGQKIVHGLPAIARLLGISERTLRTGIKSGRFPIKPLNGRYAATHRQLLALVEGRAA